MTRIIAGDYGGRRIAVPKGDGTRPTSDRAREGMFSSLQSLLDLYAGSGALALEALSRGAAHATLVDNDPQALRALIANVAAMDAPATVAEEDVQDFLKGPASSYELVVLDPPYETGVEPVLLLLRPWLADDAVVVVERRTRGPRPEPPEWLVLERSRPYGEATLWYFRAAPCSGSGQPMTGDP